MRLTSSVGGVHGFRRQTELTHERAELPGGQGTAEHTHGLEGGGGVTGVGQHVDTHPKLSAQT